MKRVLKRESCCHPEESERRPAYRTGRREDLLIKSFYFMRTEIFRYAQDDK